MDKQYIYKQLENYRVNKARLEQLKMIVESLDDKLFELNHINGLKQPILTLAPSGHTNKISTPVQDEVERRSEDWKEMECLKNRLNELNSQINELSKMIKTVEIWLFVLPDEERYVMEQRHIEDKNWFEVAVGFSKKFERACERTMQRKNGKALERILKFNKKS